MASPIKIIIDCREKTLYDACEKQKLLNDKYVAIELSSENLPLGDMIIYDQNNTELLMIERKSLLDLAASIRDGRYAEQSFRLNNCSLHNHNIIYLIEGDLRFYKPFKGNVDKKALLSAMTSIMYFKGFSLQRTINGEESAEWLMQLAYKIQKEGPKSKPYFINSLQAVAQQEVKEECETTVDEQAVQALTEQAVQALTEQAVQALTEQAVQALTEQAVTEQAVPEQAVPEPDTSEPSYTHVNKRIKKDNINIGNIGEIMLSQIPAVSPAVAISIMKKYSTLKALIAALSENKNALDDVYILDKNEKQRKISKTCIKNIYTYLHTF
jgi:ERCC4-type nuclease